MLPVAYRRQKYRLHFRLLDFLRVPLLIDHLAFIDSVFRLPYPVSARIGVKCPT